MNNDFLDKLTLADTRFGADASSASGAGAAGGAADDPVSAIESVAAEHGIDPSYLVGLAKLETRLGNSTIKGGGNDTRNLFNVKDFSGGGTRALDKAEGTRHAYRQYDSYRDSALDLVDLLRRKYPGAMDAKTPDEFARALKAGRYATDPEHANKLTRVIASQGGSHAAPKSAQQSAPSRPAGEDFLANLSYEQWAADSAQGGPKIMDRAIVAAPPQRTLGEAVADNAIGATTGVYGGIKSISDAFGADNNVSKAADFVVKTLNSAQSEERQAQRQGRQEKIRAAEESGDTWGEITANAGSFADAPLETFLNAMGSSAPTMLTALIPGLGQAGAVGLIARGMVGATQGVGAVKGSIYETVQARLEKEGMDAAEAAKVAAGAQAYDSENVGQMALGSILGFFAGGSGVESAIGRMVNRKAVGEVAGQVAGETAGKVARDAAARIGMGIVKESPVEFAQGTHERVAANVALQNLGYNDPTFKGAIGQGVGEAIASAGPGGMFGYFDRPSGPLTRALNANGTPPAAPGAAPAPPATPPATPPAPGAPPSAQQPPAAAQPSAPTAAPAPASGLQGLSDDDLNALIESIDTTEDDAVTDAQWQQYAGAIAEVKRREGAAGNAPAAPAAQVPAAPASLSSIFDTEDVYQKWSNVRDGSDRDTMLKLIDGMGTMYANAASAYTPEQLDSELKATQKWYRSGTPEQRSAALALLMAPPAAPAAPIVAAPAAGPADAGPAPYMPGREINANRAKEQPAVVLQNRDRTSAASIALMNDIAAKPNYLKVGPSREMTSGAPVVFGDLPAHAVLGRAETVIDGKNNTIQAQYAVVDALDLMASNNADGATVENYAAGLPGKLRAVAGNGRTAGIQAAYERGTASDYQQALVEDAQALGLDAGAIAAMQRPVLVRVMDAADVTPDMGDRTNTVETQVLSPVEQATTDARRINLSNLVFDEYGNPTRESVQQFLGAFTKAEQGGLVAGKSGAPTRQATQRLMAAVFKRAYDSDELVDLYAQADKPEAKAVLDAAAQSAGAMAALKDMSPEFDVSAAVAGAVKMAVNAANQGLKLSDAVKNQDLAMDDESFAVANFLAPYANKPRQMADALRNWATDVLGQAAIDRENGEQGGLFGAQPTLTRSQLFERLKGATAATDQDSNNAREAVARRNERLSQQAAAAQAAQGEQAQEQADEFDPFEQWQKDIEAAQGQQEQPAAEEDLQLNASNKPFSSEGAAKLALRKFGQGRVVPFKGGFAIQMDGRVGDAGSRASAGPGFTAASALEMSSRSKQPESPYLQAQAATKNVADNSAQDDITGESSALSAKQRWEQAKAEEAQQAELGKQESEKYNAYALEQERQAERRRLQSDRTIQQANGKPFKNEAGAKAKLDEFDLADTHAIAAVQGGFVLRHKSEGRESYTQVQAAVLADMGIGENANGEIDATEAQWSEIERRIAERLGQKPAASAQPASLELTAPNPAEIQSQQQMQEQAAKADAASQRAADSQTKADDDRKRIAAASVAAADSFELGQDPLDSLTGQGSLLDAPKEKAGPAGGVIDQLRAIENELTQLGVPRYAEFVRDSIEDGSLSEVVVGEAKRMLNSVKNNRRAELEENGALQVEETGDAIPRSGSEAFNRALKQFAMHEFKELDGIAAEDYKDGFVAGYEATPWKSRDVGRLGFDLGYRAGRQIKDRFLQDARFAQWDAEDAPASTAPAQQEGQDAAATPWVDMTPEQRRRSVLEQEVATGMTNNGGVVVKLRPSAIEKRKQDLDAMGDAGILPGTNSQQKQPLAQSQQSPAATDIIAKEQPARPNGWEKNYGAAKAVAESLGIALRGDNGKMKKAPELAAEIEALDADADRRAMDAAEDAQAKAPVEPSDLPAAAPPPMTSEQQTQLVELRKRESVLKSLVKCLGA